MRAWYIRQQIVKFQKYALSNEGLTQVPINKHRHINYAIMDKAVKKKKQAEKKTFIGPLKVVEKTRRAPF